MTTAPLFTLEEIVKPIHTAILVIDIQNDFFSEKGSVSERIEKGKIKQTLSPRTKMLPELQRFLNEARAKKVRIVFTLTARNPEEVSGPMKELKKRRGLIRELCKCGTWGTNFVDGFGPEESETIVEKTRYSAFIGTNLNEYLRKNDIRSVVLTGVGTNVCVESTARDAFMLDYYVVFLRDLTAGLDDDLVAATHRNIDEHFGRVLLSKEVLKARTKK